MFARCDQSIEPGRSPEYELALEIGRNPALEEVYARWQSRLEEMLCAYAAVLGSPDPAMDARLVLATLRVPSGVDPSASHRVPGVT